jgi:hypothetical protein
MIILIKAGTVVMFPFFSQIAFPLFLKRFFKLNDVVKGNCEDCRDGERGRLWDQETLRLRDTEGLRD